MNSRQPNSFDWKQLVQNMMDGKFPFSSDKFMAGGDLEGIHKYVQDIVAKNLSFKDSMFAGAARGFGGQHEVFESHRTVFVKLRVPEQTDPYRLRIFVNADRVRIAGLKDRSPLDIALPAKIVTKSARASVKDGILEIRMPKRSKGDKPQDQEIHLDLYFGGK